MNEVSNQSTLSLLGALPLVARTSLHHFHGRQDELCKSHDQTPIAELGLRSNGSKIGDETAPNDGEDDEQEEATEGCVARIQEGPEGLTDGRSLGQVSIR